MAEGGLITSEGSDTSSIQDYGSANARVAGLRLELTDSNTLHEVPKVCLGCSYFTFSYGTVVWVGLFVTIQLWPDSRLFTNEVLIT